MRRFPHSQPDRPWRVRRGLGLSAVALACALTWACGGTSSTPPTAPGSGNGGGGGGGGGGIGGGIGILVGAGDIAECGGQGSVLTARQLDALSGTVFTAGDNVYMNGTPQQFHDCYDPTWGRHKDRTRPTPGNHDYETPNATGYFAYFGDNAGPPGRGYYSYLAGTWTIYALDSEIDASAGSAQVQWLRGELTNHPTSCAAAIWHKPLFTSGPNGPNANVKDLWKTLYEFNVDVIINGHDHLYERFDPQDPDGRFDAARGIQEFVVGTGGASLYSPNPPTANSRTRISTWGVARFTLTDGGYQWEFLPADPTGSSDSGSGKCH